MRVVIVGTGLIGASMGLALRRGGVEVVGLDTDAENLSRAMELGALDATANDLVGVAPEADVVVVAVPVGAVAETALVALAAGAAIVTDVGSVKGPIVGTIESARPDLAERFVGGHPMAGSEQDGLEGASADQFVGATWVLTPTGHTSAEAFSAVRDLVGGLGAEVIATTPDQHDRLVAVVSHVPQLAATTLMDVAASAGEEHATLLRLAAGGFRDMTRIAAAHPGIWPDICIANREAIVAGIDDYVTALEQVRDLVSDADRAGILEVLERARAARRNLPVGVPTGERLAELRIPVPDRPGVLAEVTTLAGSLGVNIADVEIAHSAEGAGGVLVLVVALRSAHQLEAALVQRDYHCSVTELA